MKQYRTIAILVVSLSCFAFGQSQPGIPTSSASLSHSNSTEGDPFVVWTREHDVSVSTTELGHEFGDLQPLKDLVGSARVVALGESGHEIHEFLAFRNRLLEFLVRESGFTALAAETGFSEGIQVDDYIQGGSADKAVVAANVFSWSAPKAFEENLQLIEWMRDYNAHVAADRRIRFYGIDLTGGRDSDFIESRLALDASLAYLDRVDVALARQLRSRLEPFLAKFNDISYPSLSIAERSSLTATIAEIVSIFKRRRIDFLQQTTELEYARAYRQAVVAENLDAYFRNSPDVKARGRDYRDTQMVRDAAMADNLRWALDREGPRGRVLLYAHNWHVKKSPAQNEAYPEAFPGKPTTPMGQYLYSFLGDQMRVIGFTFERGVDGLKVEGKWPLAALDPESIDAALARVGLPLFVVDLRSAPKVGPIADWLNRGRKIRMNDRYGELKPLDAFDALVFVKTISAIRDIHSSTKAAK